MPASQKQYWSVKSQYMYLSTSYGFAFVDCAALQFWVGSVTDDASCAALGALLIQRPHKAYLVELAQFHSANYVEFLQRINPNTQQLFPEEMAKYKTSKLLS
ncbi:hypothetical protein L2E82_00736 [Cichorium intybus]|uniref:Uncharacterized protein n=1 Tax=Cichorium intybus TaxID=13427 RepID=A0ACB9GYE0_CICIN|nr:hypothetical protein L2E82_00736 [Cichorium intybus]